MNRRPVILVADDSEDIRNLFGVMLKKNYDVRFATNSDETLAGADTDPLPDLILLDVEMPELNGYEVCAQLKANPALAHIPVIFVTARSDPKDQARGLLAGAVDYITKPISAPITLLRVRNQLALVDQRRALEDQIAARTEELHETRLELIRRLARAMEFREGGLTNGVAAHRRVRRAAVAGARPEEQGGGDPLAGLAAARHRQARRAREHPAEVRRAERKRMGGSAQAPGNRRRHHRRAQGPAARAGAHHGAHPPRALGRHRLPEEAQGQRDPGAAAASWRSPTPSRP